MVLEFFRKHIFKILIVFWCLVIFSFSSMNALESGKQSSGIIKGTVTTVCRVATKLRIMKEMPTPKEINGYVKFLHTPIRKLAHASIYFVLALLVLIELNHNSKLSIANICVITVLFCFLYSLTDEYHQTFVPGRSGELRDCLIDSLGALTAILLIALAKMKK